MRETPKLLQLPGRSELTYIEGYGVRCWNPQRRSVQRT